VIRACQVILDRTGFPARNVLEVKTSDGDRLDLSKLTTEERGEMTALVAQMRDLKNRIKERIRPSGAQPPTPSSPVDGAQVH
jgi:hypothetical protein